MWNKIKKLITNVYAIVIFCTTGGGYGLYEFFYASPKREVIEWIQSYGDTSEGTTTYQDGVVRVKWNIQKVPPTGKSYVVVPYIATNNLAVLYSLPTSTQIAGIWGRAQTAKDWDDYDKIAYIGREIPIPEHLQKPGTYTLIYYILIQTNYGEIQVQLNPVFYTID